MMVEPSLHLNNYARVNKNSNESVNCIHQKVQQLGLLYYSKEDACRCKMEHVCKTQHCIGVISLRDRMK